MASECLQSKINVFETVGYWQRVPGRRTDEGKRPSHVISNPFLNRQQLTSLLVIALKQTCRCHSLDLILYQHYSAVAHIFVKVLLNV